MEIIKTGNDLLLVGVRNFDPFISCECGQCFRFNKNSELSYSLIMKDRLLEIEKSGENWIFKNTDAEAFYNDLVPYFDLERDYGKIIEGFAYDSAVTEAAKAGSGIRIFRQDPWETLISFIISQNNNIPRIKKIIEALCALLGEQKNGIYAFPTAQAVLKAGEDGIAPVKSGFRAKYIIDAASRVCSGEVSLERIASAGYENALAELKTIKGVGDKVANCVLLFGFGYYEAFPVDVWVKKVLAEYYPEDFDPRSFGKYAGIAQQYLFYNKRSSSAK